MHINTAAFSPRVDFSDVRLARLRQRVADCDAQLVDGEQWLAANPASGTTGRDYVDNLAAAAGRAFIELAHYEAQLIAAGQSIEPQAYMPAAEVVAEQNARPLTAHYHASGKVKLLTISESNRPVGERIPVSGRRQARQVAAQYGAQPWNF